MPVDFLDGIEEMRQDLKGKKLMMMSGSQKACEIVNVAHQMGIIVYETDWYKDSPAKKVVDKSFMVSTADVDAVVDLCRKEGVDGIISGFTDSVLPYQQQVCEKLGFPFWGDSQNIAMCIDKKLFKEACENAGLPVVPYIRLTESDYEQILPEIKVPVVFKPIDNSGSRGVYKCYDEADKKALLEKSLSFSKSKEVLAEKMMNAEKEFSVYYMLNDGQVYLTAMMDRIVMPSDTVTAPITQAVIFPSSLLSLWESEMDPYVRKFFEMNNMRNGYVFMQGFYDDGRLYVHEMGYRLNGGVAYKIVEHFSGFNQIEQLIRFTLTGRMEDKEVGKTNPHFDGYGLILATTLNNGTIGKVSGLDKVGRIDGVLDCRQYHFEGDSVNGLGTSANDYADIFMVASSLDKLAGMISQIEELLKVVDTEGNNMLLPFLDIKRIPFLYRQS